MAEEFQAEICGGSWWNPSRSVFSAAAAAAAVASPCSMGLGHDVAGFGNWPMSHMIDHHTMIDNNNNNNNKARSNSSGETNNSVCESPNIAFQEVLQKPHHQHAQTDLLIDSTLQMMGFGLSPSDLNQPNLVSSGRSENNSAMYSMLQEDMGAKLNNNYRQDHHQHQTALSTDFPAGSASFGSYESAALLQSLFDGDSQLQAQPQQFCSRSLDYSPPNNIYGSNNGNSNNMVTPSTNWTRNNISAPRQPAAGAGGLHFSNNTPFWNASEAVSSESNARPSLINFPPAAPQQYATPAFEQKPKCNNNNNLATATKLNMVPNEDVHQESGAKKGGNNGGDREQPVLKRARIETPSPLPTFKVRKEKLGDRITALQQLVSPFGKNDTASVLHEAIEYIKFLHDQVSVLSTPYMKNGTPVQVHQQGINKLKDQENPKQDLKSRGLCLVPISSTFPVANETTADFWTPTFGGTFR